MMKIKSIIKKRSTWNGGKTDVLQGLIQKVGQKYQHSGYQGTTR